MKAYRYQNYGSPEVLQLCELEKPVPKNNEILIKVKATTVTRGDVRMRGFVVPALFWIPSRIALGIFKPKRSILGMECAGVIEAIGKDVTKFKEGDEVFASTFEGMRFGAHAEYICLPQNGLIAVKPKKLTFGEAASLATGGVAALLFIQKTNIQNWQQKQKPKMLINGASGTLGTFCIQFAQYYGAEVTGVCSSKNINMVKSLGAHKVIDYTKTDFTKLNERYDFIFDSTGFLKKAACRRMLNAGGKFESINTAHNARLNVEDLYFLKKLVDEGHLKPVIDREYTFDQMIEAHHYVDKGHKTGNVVIRLD